MPAKRGALAVAVVLAVLIFPACKKNPQISSVSPKSVQPGDSLTIKGSNFTGGDGTQTPKVKIGGTSAAVTSATDDTIVATVPPGATGGQAEVEVENNAGTGQSTVEITAPGPAPGSATTEPPAPTGNLSDLFSGDVPEMTLDTKASGDETLDELYPPGKTTKSIRDFIQTAGMVASYRGIFQSKDLSSAYMTAVQLQSSNDTKGLIDESLKLADAQFGAFVNPKRISGTLSDGTKYTGDVFNESADNTVIVVITEKGDIVIEETTVGPPKANTEKKAVDALGAVASQAP